VNKRIYRFDSAVRASGFTGVVVVRQAGTVVFNEAYGFATPRWQVPNTVDTRFDTASITKLFTSVAVLQQVGLDRLDLDASIHRYVDLSGTTISSEVTLRHLLTHTSGLADNADEQAGEVYADLFADSPCHTIIETVDFLPQFAHKPALAEPGFEPDTAT
jgi:CubicO group peptidase (beta-lactamase class C family)